MQKSPNDEFESFSDFVGNQDAVEKLNIKIQAHKLSGNRFCNLGIFGPSGVGKTTLSKIVSKELSGEFLYINATAIKSPITFRKQIAQGTELANINNHCVIMIDECHCLPRKIQDNLLSLLEEPAILCTAGYVFDKKTKQIVKNEGEILREKLPLNVSFVFATTHQGSLTDAMLNRLFRVDLENYTKEDLSKIALINLNKNIENFEETEHKYLLEIIAENARSARDVVKICENIKDIALIRNVNKLDKETVQEAIRFSGFEHNGLTRSEIGYIKYLSAVGRCSLNSISGFLNLSIEEVEEKIEPFLIRKGIISKETKGRKLTEIGIKLLKSVESVENKEMAIN